jgi:TetR/AcrR family transcriptional regulator, tetracycline repressor protein
MDRILPHPVAHGQVNGVQVVSRAMSHRRADVIEHALTVLDRHGLADLSMRRLAADLGVRPSALYWHFDSKQSLLAAVADEVLRRGDRPVPDGPWADRVTTYAHNMRDAMLAYRDGAELVATTQAFGLGEIKPVDQLVELIGDTPVGRVAATTVLHFVLGHVTDEQMNLQASSAGAIADDPLARADTFATGLAIIVAGIAARRDAAV